MAHDRAIADLQADVPPEAHRRRDRIAWAQIWLPALAIVLAASFWAADWLHLGESRYSPGPLANVHATWDDHCVACHTTAEPLSDQHWTRLVVDHGDPAGRCQTCHAGPVHHVNEIPGEAPGCASCHVEHRGRGVDLKRVANEQCTRCHQHLADHVKEGAVVLYENVTDFSADGHPEFRLLREPSKDAGRISFNHKLHLAPGLREQGASSVPFTLADLPQDARERYRMQGQTDTAPLKLDCASCHRTEVDPGNTATLAGLPASAVQAARSAGAQMLPITYEVHCQACHPLTFTIKDAKDRKAPQPQAVHRRQPAELRQWLRGYFTDLLLQERPPLLNQPVRPLPGRSPKRDESAKTLGQSLQATIERAEHMLHGPNTCGKCHASLRSELGAGQPIEPVNVPAVWFTSARFDHRAHRGVACQVCHARAETSRHNIDVLLPDRDVCLECHAPARQAGDRRMGGARHDCVECHRYHGGDHPLQGRGSARRRPAGAAMDIQQFLEGRSP